MASHIKSGKLRALGVTSAQPSALMPGVPAVASAGLPGFEFVGLDAVFAPARTPAAIVNRLNTEIVRYLHTPEAKQKFFAAGIEVAPSSPAELPSVLKADIVKVGKVIRDAGITGE